MNRLVLNLTLNEPQSEHFKSTCLLLLLLLLSFWQISLLELNFLPTTGTKLTKQQLILASE